MANYNRIILVGNLTRDPQLKYLPSQLPVVEFGMAVNHKFKTRDGQDRDEVLFIDCSCFGKGAEVINTYCQKGKQLLVEGRLKYDTWEDKQGGGKRSKHTVVVDNFQLMGGPRDGGGGPPQGSYDEAGGAPAPARPPVRPPARPPQQGAPQQAAPQQPASEPPFAAEQQFSEDDIPF
ncbi:MAG TPA: single-stranded DNA-binding protein [Tepidisphaeraceae bacterium]|jgi:single-strand DNA-binding protein|nr:single-stranded DNA-binding protein [Tepidisphaeraceae bacterium]